MTSDKRHFFTKEELKHLKYRLITEGHTPDEAQKRIKELIEAQKSMAELETFRRKSKNI